MNKKKLGQLFGIFLATLMTMWLGIFDIGVFIGFLGGWLIAQF